MVTLVCVCLSARGRMLTVHYCTDPDVTWGVVGDAPNRALLGRFAIGGRVALLRQQSEREMLASTYLYSLYAYSLYCDQVKTLIVSTYVL